MLVMEVENHLGLQELKFLAVNDEFRMRRLIKANGTAQLLTIHRSKVECHA